MDLEHRISENVQPWNMEVSPTTYKPFIHWLTLLSLAFLTLRQLASVIFLFHRKELCFRLRGLVDAGEISCRTLFMVVIALLQPVARLAVRFVFVDISRKLLARPLQIVYASFGRF